LGGSFEKGSLRSCEKNGRPLCDIYLPSSLFEGCQEGETVRFFYDSQLIELTCQQAGYPLTGEASPTFEDTIRYAKAQVAYERAQALWQDDLGDKPRFMGELVGQSLATIDPSNESKIKIRDFQFYEGDQTKHGIYRPLKVIGHDENSLVFDITKDSSVAISEIVLIESKGFNGLHQLWILIPHKPELNKFPKGNILTQTYGTHVQTLDENSFNPQLGHRMLQYRHGQYFMCKVRDVDKAKLFYNGNGWLQLNLE
jgi:hypothetical protein